MNYRHIFVLLCFPIFIAAGPPVNEIPLYEGVKKTPEQVAADQAFVKEVENQPGGKAAAINQLLATAWQAIQAGDLPLSIRRYNQVYLLDKKEYRAYWGLGTATGIQGDIGRAERIFRKGLEYNQTDVRFLSDVGFCFQQAAFRAAQQKNIDPRPKLNEAKKLFELAIKLDAKAALPHARLAVIYFFEGNCAGAQSEIATAQKAGGDGLDPKFIADLKAQCP